jgi:uncharacterized membrane protein YciS (DUF1049 family)
MIAQTLNTLVSEVSGLLSWIICIIAGWGLTFTAVVAALVYAHIRIARLKKELDNVRNYLVSETRDLSLRIRKLEK